ncbi:hypothetical protein Nans01_15780 [Nocardiopsis ansamitocini]|uniref:Uncharacterized protein n=1 Tax=Nocardiopsis ansamitocini TaxID=1670832 RepID=A0A9W6P538_9ACTN|nr:hypothetical protein Nans01_15780 [Nocardiopsis ansamitocini]
MLTGRGSTKRHSPCPLSFVELLPADTVQQDHGRLSRMTGFKGLAAIVGTMFGFIALLAIVATVFSP